MSVTSELKQPFVDKLLPIAREVYAYAQVHPAILIAQAAHESAWGTSRLTLKANNLFGITAGSWVGRGRPVFGIPTMEYCPEPPKRIRYWNVPGDIISKKPSPRGGTDLMVNAFFRKYSDWKESCEDWVKLLIRRYPTAYVAAQLGNFTDFARGLTGYATDPRYAEKICLYKDEPLLQNLVA
jgi:flagellum-specific peptidoglycan hydrolase FlgJ